jgi:flagellar motor switch protein FliN/FliY
MIPSSPGDSGAPEAAQNTGTMDLLMDVELPVTVRFGSTRMLLRDLLKLTAGSIIEFNRSRENPVEILVNSRVVARGSAIVVAGNYGVRIGEVAPDAVRGVGREN